MKKDNVWVGAEDLTNDSKFNERAQQEFFELPIVEGLSQDNDVIETATSNSNRRDFLKYLGFGLGAATVAASCEIPVRKAIPYVVKPDAIVPGVASYYATSYVNGGDYCSVLVKTREGRPIKIEGNALSPVSKGGTSARAQASVLDLYNKNRFKSPMSDGKAMTWEDLDKALATSAGMQPDAQIRIVTNTILSPSLKKAIADFTVKYPNTKVVSYDAVSSTGTLLANEACFGKRVIPAYHFDKAEVVVNFGADFLGTWLSPVEFASDFAKSRKITDTHHPKISRLIQVESTMSLTGSNADNRVLIKPSERGAATIALYNEVAKLTGGSAIGGAKLGNAKAAAAMKAAAKDLVKSQGKSIVLSGSNDTNEQIIVNAINNMLGNYGATMSFNAHSNQRQGIDADIQGLIGDMNAGRVDTVIVHGSANPAYDIPNADKFAEGLAKVKLSVSLSGMPNETTDACQYVAPDHHFLESWGDAEPKNGHYALIQPTISPLFETRSAIETFLTLSGNTTSAYDYIKSVWEAATFPAQSQYLTFQSFWDNAVHDGVVTIEKAAETSAFAGDAAAAAAKVTKPSSGGFDVEFYESVQIGDGSHADNPWLQEMPDPITRTVWDNPVKVPLSYEDGNKNYTFFNGMEDGDISEMTFGEASEALTITNQFGQAAGTAAIALGYGRTSGGAGKYVGKNMFKYLTIKNGTTQYFISGAEFSGKKGEDEEYATVQYHHTFGVTTEKDGEEINIDEEILAYQGALTDRSIIYTADVKDLHKKVEEVKDKREHAQELNSKSLYPGFEGMYGQGHHWGMSVDMNACIGCGACQVACIAENNVPIVGKKEVRRHHEMTWLRIDRYYYGDVNNPNVVYQPMMCQHCDNAPCENVCPVNATNHSGEGLNQMTYNRCIGTRYCANNCPYKVRRFNWLDYTSADLFPWNEAEIKEGDVYMADNLTRMVLNPDVTVRSRGVIEKCSFCVQRIQEAKLTAKVEKRRLADNDLKTACQSACPTDAIVFGDTNNKNSEVSKRNDSDLNYVVLEEINVKSSVGYLMRVTNKNEEIA